MNQIRLFPSFLEQQQVHYILLESQFCFWLDVASTPTHILVAKFRLTCTKESSGVLLLLLSCPCALLDLNTSLDCFVEKKYLFFVSKLTFLPPSYYCNGSTMMARKQTIGIIIIVLFIGRLERYPERPCTRSHHSKKMKCILLELPRYLSHLSVCINNKTFKTHTSHYKKDVQIHSRFRLVYFFTLSFLSFSF